MPPTASGSSGRLSAGDTSNAELPAWASRTLPQAGGTSAKVRLVRDHLKRLAERSAARLGYEIHRADHTHAARRMAAMRRRGVDVVLDVGANTGQYVTELRQRDYRGRIISFEPMPHVFADLTRLHRGDSLWRGICRAAGATPGTATFNVIPSSTVLSSMLAPTPELLSALPGARHMTQIEVDVVRLDDVWHGVVPANSTTFLKIDTQGFESEVLAGCQTHLGDVSLLEVEMSLVPTYEQGSSLLDLLPKLVEWGFAVISIDSNGGYVQTSTGQALDVNVLAGRPA